MDGQELKQYEEHLLQQLEDPDVDVYTLFNDMLKNMPINQIHACINRFQQYIKLELYNERKQQQKQLSDAISHTQITSNHLRTLHESLHYQYQNYQEQQHQLDKHLSKLTQINLNLKKQQNKVVELASNNINKIGGLLLNLCDFIKQGKYLTATSFIHVLEPYLDQEEYKQYNFYQQLEQLKGILINIVLKDAVYNSIQLQNCQQIIINRQLFQTVFKHQRQQKVELVDEYIIYLLTQITVDYEQKGLQNSSQIVSLMQDLNTTYTIDQETKQHIILTQQQILYYIICYFDVFDKYFQKLNDFTHQNKHESENNILILGQLETHSEINYSQFFGQFESINQFKTQLNNIYQQTNALIQMKQISLWFQFMHQYKRVQIYIQQFVQKQFTQFVKHQVTQIFQYKSNIFNLSDNLTALCDVIKITLLLQQYKMKFRQIGYVIDYQINDFCQQLIKQSIQFSMKQLSNVIQQEQSVQKGKHAVKYYQLIFNNFTENDYQFNSIQSSLLQISDYNYTQDLDEIGNSIGIFKYFLEKINQHQIDLLNNNSIQNCHGMYMQDSLRFLQTLVKSSKTNLVNTFDNKLMKIIYIMIMKYKPKRIFLNWFSDQLNVKNEENYFNNNFNLDNLFVISLNQYTFKFLQTFQYLIELMTDDTIPDCLQYINASFMNDTQDLQQKYQHQSADFQIQLGELGQQLVTFIYVIPFITEILILKHQEQMEKIQNNYIQLNSKIMEKLQLNIGFILKQYLRFQNQKLADTYIKLQFGNEVLQIFKDQEVQSGRDEDRQQNLEQSNEHKNILFKTISKQQLAQNTMYKQGSKQTAGNRASSKQVQSKKGKQGNSK